MAGTRRDFFQAAATAAALTGAALTSQAQAPGNTPQAGGATRQSDPPRMYAVMRKTAKPCFAFKILAAGRVANAERAFQLAYESIKPTDGVFIGLFPKMKDEIGENAVRVHRLLAGA